MAVPSGSQPKPGPFARAISGEIRSVMARERVSGAQLASRIGRSQTYLAKRLRDEVPLGANDVEDICRELGVDLGSLLIAAVRASRRRQDDKKAPTDR